MSEKLHDDIIKALPPDFVRRMMNWSRTVDGTPVSTSKLEERVDHTRQEQGLPILMGEADDTHRAIRALPQRYQEVVGVFWTRLAQDMRWMSQSTPRLRLWKLGPASFRDWLDRAHERLITHFGAQQPHEAKARDDRRRARPQGDRIPQQKAHQRTQ